MVNKFKHSPRIQSYIGDTKVDVLDNDWPYAEVVATETDFVKSTDIIPWHTAQNPDYIKDVTVHNIAEDWVKSEADNTDTGDDNQYVDTSTDPDPYPDAEEFLPKSVNQSYNRRMTALIILAYVIAAIILYYILIK